MVADTAVEVPEAAVEEPQDTISEIVAPDASATPETEGDAETPETDQPASETAKPDTSTLLAGLDDDGIESLPQVKALLARRQESARRKSEHETSERLRSEKEAWVSQGQWVADLSTAYAMDEDGNVGVDTKKVNRITGDLASYALQNASLGVLDSVNTAVDKALPSGFAISRDEQSHLQEAYADFKADPAKVGNYVGRLMDVVKRAVIEDSKESIIAEARKTWEKELATKAKAASVKQADEANSHSGSPTAVRGVASNQRGPTPAEYASASREQRASWRREGVNPVLAQ